MNSLVIRSLAIVALCLSTAFTASGGGIVSTPDEASLRSALIGGGQVLFECDGVITLTSSLVITNPTSIDAAGRSITLSGGGAVRILVVSPGSSLELRNLTLSDGHVQGTNGIAAVGSPANADGGPAYGGALWIENGTLVSSNCIFLRNRAVGGTGGPAGSPFGPPPGVGGHACGGAIYGFNSSLTLESCTITLSEAIGGEAGQTYPFDVLGGNARGGAVFLSGGTLHMIKTTVSTNRSLGGRGRYGASVRYSGGASGGGVEGTGSVLEIENCTFANNRAEVERGDRATALGGACRQSGGSSIVLNSFFVDNEAIGGVALIHSVPIGLPGGDAYGGAFYSSSADSHITNCTFQANATRGGLQMSGNTPGKAYGGAIFNSGNQILCNSTFAWNSAIAGQSDVTGMQSSALGGGIYNQGTQTVDSVTIAHNSAIPSSTNFMNIPQAFGGGIYTTNGEMKIVNSIVAHNTAGSNVVGNIVDLGHNLSSDSSAAFSSGTSMNSVEPRLGPLANFGGATPTFALTEGSPAIDAGAPKDQPATDQRGRIRPFGTAPDIGAFESSPPYTVVGRVSGRTLTAEVQVGTQDSMDVTTVDGSYTLQGLVAGSFTIAASSPDYLFVPQSREITVGPDRFDVDFKAYRWNALSLDAVTNGTLHIVYPGTNGQAVTIQFSEDLKEWTSVATNMVGANNLIELLLPVETSARRFFRTSR